MDDEKGMEENKDIVKKDTKQINVCFKMDEYGKIVTLCKGLDIKSVSGFIKESFFEGLEKTIDKKKKFIELLNGNVGTSNDKVE